MGRSELWARRTSARRCATCCVAAHLGSRADRSTLLGPGLGRRGPLALDAYACLATCTPEGGPAQSQGRLPRARPGAAMIGNGVSAWREVDDIAGLELMCDTGHLEPQPATHQLDDHRWCGRVLGEPLTGVEGEEHDTSDVVVDHRTRAGLGGRGTRPAYPAPVGGHRGRAPRWRRTVLPRRGLRDGPVGAARAAPSRRWQPRGSRSRHLRGAPARRARSAAGHRP